MKRYQHSVAKILRPFGDDPEILQTYCSLFSSRRSQALKEEYILLEDSVLEFKRPHPIEQSLWCRALHLNRVLFGTHCRPITQQLFIKTAHLKPQRLKFHLIAPASPRCKTNPTIIRTT